MDFAAEYFSNAILTDAAEGCLPDAKSSTVVCHTTPRATPLQNGSGTAVGQAGLPMYVSDVTRKQKQLGMPTPGGRCGRWRRLTMLWMMALAAAVAALAVHLWEISWPWNGLVGAATSGLRMGLAEVECGVLMPECTLHLCALFRCGSGLLELSTNQDHLGFGMQSGIL